MGFDYLLCNCLVPDSTQHAEQGRGIRIARLAGETILLFTPDEKRVREMTRQYFGVPQFCDVIIFYQKLSKQVILFVELKGSKVEDAIVQLGSAIDAVCRKSRLRDRDPRLYGLIVSTKSSPDLIKKAQQGFMKSWKVTLMQKTLPNGTLDLRTIIRDLQ